MSHITKKIIAPIIGIVFTGMYQAIIITFLDVKIQSGYFISLMTSIQFCIIFGIMYFFFADKKIAKQVNKKLIFFAGLFNAFMAILLVYASDPRHTPVILQSALSTLSVVFSVISSKILLSKRVEYNKKFIIPSLLLLTVTIIVPTISISSEILPSNIGWCFAYAAGILCMSIYNVLQEKYITESGDNSFSNKLTLLFFMRIVQVMIVIGCFWLEFIFGTSPPFSDFGASFRAFFTPSIILILFESFVISYLLLYIFSVYLNSISTNYNMITTIAINPSVAVFFTIFPSWNPGIKYPIYSVVISQVCAIISLILWIKGEKNLYIPVSLNNDI